MEVYAWVEEQRERNSRAFYRLLEQGRQVWTPNHIFNRCCVKWLVDGVRAVDDGDGYGLYDEYSPRNGCRRCSRDHPCITLRFDAATKSTTAILSHQLDPFVRFFDGLVAEGKAWPDMDDPAVYELDGYLRTNETALRLHDGFGSHLVKVDQGSREASDAAQTAELDEKERAKKRPRLKGNEGGPDSFDMLEEVMDVVVKERLLLDLQNDPMMLFCMRPVCKMFKKIATSIASEKVKKLDLSITPLVNGKQQYGEDKLLQYDPETFDVECYDMYNDTGVYEFEKKKKVLLAFQESQEAGTGTEGGYYPVDAEAATITWDSGDLNRDADGDNDECESAEESYCGPLLRVFWHPSQSDPVKAKARYDSLDERATPLPCLGIRVAEFNLLPNPNRGNMTKSWNGITINYEVIESNTSEREEEEPEEDADNEYSSDEEEASANSPQRTRYIKYTGKIKLISVKCDFGVLVRAHALQVMGEIRRKHSNILKERPLAQSEKGYGKLVAAAIGSGPRLQDFPTFNSPY